MCAEGEIRQSADGARAWWRRACNKTRKAFPAAPILHRKCLGRFCNLQIHARVCRVRCGMRASLRLREQHEELHVGDGAARHRRLLRLAAQRVARLPGALAARPHASARTTDQDLEGTNSATGKQTVHADCVQQARSVNALLWLQQGCPQRVPSTYTSVLRALHRPHGSPRRRAACAMTCPVVQISRRWCGVRGTRAAGACSLGPGSAPAGAAAEQQLGGRGVVAQDGIVQRRAPTRVGHAGGRARLQQVLEQRGAANLARARSTPASASLVPSAHARAVRAAGTIAPGAAGA